MRISDWSSDLCSSDLADAAVHLHALAHRKVGSAAGLRLGDGNYQLCAFAALIEQLLRLHHRGARDFHLAIKVRGAVLERLKFADQLAELLAFLAVGYGHVHRSE